MKSTSKQQNPAEVVSGIVTLKIAGNGYYDLYVKGKRVTKGNSWDEDGCYNLIAEDDKYMAIGHHGCNPGCYKNLDSVYMICKETGAYEWLRLWDYLGSRYSSYGEDSKLRCLYTDKEPGVFIAESDHGIAKIDANLVFAPDLIPGTVISPNLSMKKPETWFNYQVCERQDILMILKDDIPRVKLLDLPGFDMQYNAFKIGGDWTEGSFEFLNIDLKTGTSVTYDCRLHQLGVVLKPRCERLISFMEAVVPNHPVIRDYKKVSGGEKPKKK